jgi:Uncharacterized protein conserved in cyanobacteria
MTPSPSTKHQRISSRLHAKLFNFLEGKECEVFPAPFDIELRTADDDQGDQTEKTKVVIPDLSVICDKTTLDENKYVGSPELIIEIISPSNQAHDLVKKLNLYMTPCAVLTNVKSSSQNCFLLFCQLDLPTLTSRLFESIRKDTI